MQASTQWKEVITPDEAARFESYAIELTTLQAKMAKTGKPGRALHAKGGPGLEATFTVLSDLPSETRVGLFSQPASYRAFVRFSNGSAAHQTDRKPDIRGVALKILGVTGRKIIPGMEDALTQDFLLIRSAATPVRNADEFMALIRAGTSPLTGLPAMLRQLGLRRVIQILRKGSAILKPTTSLATTRFYSALPIQFGDYAVHYALRPHALPEPGDCISAGRDYLAEELSERLRRGPVSFDFQIQFHVDDERTPIEDASVEWREQDAPFVTVGLLTLSQQDTSSARGQRLRDFIETLSFDPWHALTQFRPLGNMMRARDVAYRHSTQARQAAREPDGTELLD